MRKILLMLLLCQPCYAFDNGQYGDVPDNIRSWFKSVRSPNGVPCCDIADGHQTSYDIRPPSTNEGSDYWIPIESEWYNVPKAAIVYGSGNPIGEAIVWYVKQGNGYHIRCYVPAGGV